MRQRGQAIAIVMVEDGIGITLLPRRVIDAGAARNALLALTPLRGAWPREAILAWRKSSARQDDFERSQSPASTG
jgi:LysR family hydrogen peroxide-inducible transcriptional activator